MRVSQVTFYGERQGRGEVTPLQGISSNGALLRVWLGFSVLTGLPGMSPGGFLKDIALDQGSRAVQGCFYLPYLPVSVSWAPTGAVTAPAACC